MRKAQLGIGSVNGLRRLLMGLVLRSEWAPGEEESDVEERVKRSKHNTRSYKVIKHEYEHFNNVAINCSFHYDIVTDTDSAP